MKIEIVGFSCSVISTEYKYRKSKKNGRRYRRKVPLKKPYLAITHDIKAYGDCILGAAYQDNNGSMWVCVRKYNITEPIGELRMAQLKQYKTYTLPTHITPISIPVGEA